MNLIEPDLATLVEAEIAREACRFRIHRREADRHRGVAWAACGPEAFRPRSLDDLTQQARRSLDDRAAWLETKSARFLSAVAEGQQIAGAAHQACERARAAWSRDFPGEAATCATAARELRAHALGLLRKARLAERALTNGPPPSRGSCARSATPADARE